MTMLFMDGFDHYGVGTNDADQGAGAMLDGVYTGTGSCSIDAPSWGARTGPYALHVTQGGAPRKVFDWGGKTAFLVGMGFSTPGLPGDNTTARLWEYRDGGNALKWSVALLSTGAIALMTSANAILVQTAAPVIVASNWHFVEFKIDTVAGTFRLDVDGATVINASGLSLASTSIAQCSVGFVQAGASFVSIWIDDLTIRDTSGTHNNDFEGDLRVATMFPNADAVAQGWTPEPRQKIATGILNANRGTFGGSGAAVYATGGTNTNLGAGDYCLEGFYRFAALPTGSNKAVIYSKWNETLNKRAFQLYLGGPTLDGGNLTFRTSTDGTGGTVVNKISYPWPGGTPDLDVWYHIAVVRASGELLLFIDGVQYGLPIADPDTNYYVGTAEFSFGSQVEGGTTVANTYFAGWMDELRVSVGVPRYIANFTPTTVPFGRNVSTDPNFASDVLLCGFDSGIFDESSYLRTLTASLAVQETPGDGLGGYSVINHHFPQDDTFIQAALLAAGSILTLSAQPAANDTVTVGTYTNSGSHAAVYKFVAALSTAFDVKIGATVADTLFNLRSAINLAPGAGTLYGAATFVNDDVTAAGLPGDQMAVTANIAGTAGNAIASTSSLTHGGGWTGTTLAGGANIPGYSEFYFDRPPVNTTIIKAVQIVNRSFKSDAGTGSAQASFIGPLGGVENGADNALTVSPVYRWDVFETDPDTSGSITPSTIVGGRVRIDRTA